MRVRTTASLLLGSLAGVMVAQPAAFRLPTGLQIRVQSTHQRPFLHVFLTLRIPEDLAEGDRRLLGDLLATAGGGAMERSDFLRGVADRALDVQFREGPGTWTWVVRGESPELDGVLEALVQLVARPNLGGAWKAAQAGPASEGAGRERFLGRLGLPGGTRPLPEGASFARALALHRRAIRPERATLTLRGDISLPQAQEASRRHFGIWAPGTPDPLPGEPSQPDPARILVAPGSGGPALWAGLEPPAAPWDPRAERILARRLHGLAEPQDGILLSKRALPEGASPLEAAQAFLAELDRRLAAPVTESELAEAGASLRREDAFSPLHPADPPREDAPGDGARLKACLRPEAVRSRVVLLLEGLGPESQAGLAALGLGPASFLSR